MQPNFFDIRVVAITWHNSHENMEHLPLGDGARLATEIREWYEGLDDEIKYYAREAEISPCSNDDKHSQVFIKLETSSIGGETNIEKVPSGSESFIYNLKTNSTHVCHNKTESLKQALSRTLKGILQHDIDFMKYVGTQLERAVLTLGED